MGIVADILVDVSAYFLVIGIISYGIYYLIGGKLNKFLMESAQRKALEDASEQPRLVFHKQWQNEDNILGSLHLECAGRTTIEARQSMDYLIKISIQHDNECLKNSKSSKDNSIG